MADVITRLKVDSSGFDKKIKDAQRSIDQFGLKGTEVGNRIKALSDALSLNVGSISKFSVAMAAAGAAIKVATDAFKANEEMMDEWGRITESSRAIYDGFLNAINTGDISGYLSRIGEIRKAAREAYDAMDELGTFNAFNRNNLSAARAGFNQKLADYRTGNASKEDVSKAQDALKKILEDREKLERNNYLSKIGEKAATAGVDEELLRQYLEGSYGDYKKVKDTPFPTKNVWNSSTRSMVQAEAPELATPIEKLGKMLRQLTDDQLSSLQALAEQANKTQEELAQIDKQAAKILNTKTVSSGNGKSAAASPATASPAAPTLIGPSELEIANELALRQLEPDQPLYQELMAKAATIPITIPVQVVEDEEQVEETLAGINSEVKDMAGVWDYASQAIGSVGSALAGIEDPALNILGIVAQAIANVVAGLGSAIAQKGKDLNAWSWIAFTATATATMIATVASIKQVMAEYHAGGDFVGKGNRFNTMMRPVGTDTIPAMLSPGELVLNKSQQSNLASNLQAAPALADLHLETTIEAERIRIMLNNNNRRRGRGIAIQ